MKSESYTWHAAFALKWTGNCSVHSNFWYVKCNPLLINRHKAAWVGTIICLCGRRRRQAPGSQAYGTCGRWSLLPYICLVSVRVLGFLFKARELNLLAANLASVKGNEDIVRANISKECSEGWVWGPFSMPPVLNLRVVPLEMVLKKAAN